MRYDVVVVGGGSGGAVIASRLSQDPARSVLLLEAGPDYQRPEELPEDVRYGYGTRAGHVASSHDLWGYEARLTGQSNSHIPRGKVMGGSSAVNALIFLRGLPEDHDAWVEAGGDDWSYQSMLPYLRRIESDRDYSGDFHGTEGPIPVRRFLPEDLTPAQAAFHRACLDLGFPDSPDHNDPESTGVGPLPLNLDGRERVSAAVAYLAPARHRLNLTIRGDCHVHRVLFEDQKAVGVEVESGGERFTVEAGEVILAAGAIATPQLLMLSGVGPADELGRHDIPVVRNLTGVGKNLQDHPVLLTIHRTLPGYELDGLGPWMQMCLRFTATGSPHRNDLMLTMGSYAGATKRAEAVDELVGVYIGGILQHSESRGQLTLASADPTDNPVLDYQFLETEFDVRRAREVVRVCVELGKHPAFAGLIDQRIEPEDLDIATDEALGDWLMTNAQTGHHVSGTCRMGPASSDGSVVDGEGRVHGLAGLRIADASVIPQIPRANTNVPTLSLAERIADYMLGE